MKATHNAGSGVHTSHELVNGSQEDAMSKKANLSSMGLPARGDNRPMVEQLDREDLRKLILLLTRLRRYFEGAQIKKPIDETIEIVYSLSEDWTRQAAQRNRDKIRRYDATRRK